MTNSPLQDSSNFNYNLNDNIQFIYNYTESILLTRQKTIENLNTALGAFLAASGVLLRTAMDLPSIHDLSIHTQITCLSCQILKIITYILLTASIFICCVGIIRQPVGNVVSPQRLKDLYSSKLLIYGKSFVINTWIEQTIPQLDNVINHKGNFLKTTIICFIFAVTCFAGDIAIATLF